MILISLQFKQIVWHWDKWQTFERGNIFFQVGKGWSCGNSKNSHFDSKAPARSLCCICVWNWNISSGFLDWNLVRTAHHQVVWLTSNHWNFTGWFTRWDQGKMSQAQIQADGQAFNKLKLRKSSWDMMKTITHGNNNW